MHAGLMNKNKIGHLQKNELMMIIEYATGLKDVTPLCDRNSSTLSQFCVRPVCSMEEVREGPFWGFRTEERARSSIFDRGAGAIFSASLPMSVMECAQQELRGGVT